MNSEHRSSVKRLCDGPESTQRVCYLQRIRDEERQAIVQYATTAKVKIDVPLVVANISLITVRVCAYSAG